MSKVIVKKWINGNFEKVREFAIADVKQVQNTSNGLRLVFNDNVLTFDDQCVIEFE